MATKRIIIALLSIFFSVIAYATEKDLEKDITMVSYEQSWLDSYGTLALKNNTSEDIRNVVFLITYLDMSGKELDYEEFKEKVDIAPGMTRKLDIPAYEQNRQYHYYKTKDEFGHPAFKIKFKLKDYNVEDIGGEDIEEADPYNLLYNQNDAHSDGREELYIPLFIIIALLAIGIHVGLYVLVAFMAQKRNRSVVGWIFLSLIATPVLMAIILLVIGDNRDCRDSHVMTGTRSLS